MNPFTAFDRRLPDDLRTDEQIEEDAAYWSARIAKPVHADDAAKWEKVEARLTNRSEK